MIYACFSWKSRVKVFAKQKKTAPRVEGLQVILPYRFNIPALVALAERSLQEHP